MVDMEATLAVRRRSGRGSDSRLRVLRSLNLDHRLWALFDSLKNPDTGENWTVQEIASRTVDLEREGIGIAASAPMISQIRTGSVVAPSYASIVSIAAAFGITVDYFASPNWRGLLEAEKRRRRAAQ